MKVALRILLSSLLLLAWSHSLISGLQASSWTLVIYLLTGGHYTLYLVWGSLLRDLRYAVLFSMTSQIHIFMLKAELMQLNQNQFPSLGVFLESWKSDM